MNCPLQIALTKVVFMKSPLLVVCDSKGNIFEIPDLLMVGASLNSIILPDDTNVIPLPKSSILFTLPKRIPVGYDPISQKIITI